MVLRLIHLKGMVLWMVMGCFLAAAPALAAPGDPLAGDHTGCTPSTPVGIKCAKKALWAVTVLRRAVLACHVTQAQHAFANGEGTPGFSNAEENCETGPSNRSAKAVFDASMAALVAKGCDATVIAHALATRDVILGDKTVAGSIDNLNAALFCDATSGHEIDPGGDDGGFIPTTFEHYHCSAVVAKAWAKLIGFVAKCHIKQAAAIFKERAFDEDTCEDSGPRSALEKYNYKVNSVIDVCPPCLNGGANDAFVLGANTVNDAEADLEDIYVCPGP
jgi:hypothetical protein